jgi:hypothetical protein
MKNVRTDAGLIVPASAVAKTQRVLPKDSFKQIVRFVRAMRPEGIQILLGCSHCKEALDLTMVDQLVEDVPVGGRPVLTCKCSERVVR